MTKLKGVWKKWEKNIASNFSSSFYITCLFQFQLCYFLQRLFFGGLGLGPALVLRLLLLVLVLELCSWLQDCQVVVSELFMYTLIGCKIVLL